MAAMLVAGMASAQSVSVIGKDGSTIATYDLDQVNQIVFTPGEDTPSVDVPEGWIGIELEEGLFYEGIQLAIDDDAINRNFERWPIDKDTNTEISRMGKWLSNRTSYLDTVISGY